MKSNDSVEKDLLRFKLAVLNSPGFTAKDLVVGGLDGDASVFSNRGNKLLYNSDGVDYTNLNSYRDDLKLVKIEETDPETGERRPRYVIRRKDQTVEEIIQRELDDEFGIVDEDDEYKQDYDSVQGLFDSVDVAEILAPITHPTNIVERKTLERIYKSRHLEDLAEQTIELIEKEQDNVIQLSKLMSVFLGDCPEDLLADNLKLPNYDHNLDLEKQIARSDENGTNRDMDATQEEDDDEGQNGNESAQDSRKINERIKDPFFKLPEYKRDPNFGIRKAEDAEESRQLIQIALQRNEEFIRSLTTIRNGFIRADRVKNNIYKWSKEMAEENYDKSEESE